MPQLNQKSALVFILITICLDSIGLGIIIPSFPQLIAETAHVGLNESAKYFGWVMGIYAAMQFLFAPMIGNLSDRFGRRPILLFSVFGMGFDYLIMYIAPDLFWLVIGRAIAGIFGASYTTAASYIADISTPDNRAQNFGMIGAAFGMGFIIGPAIGGLLADFGTRAPFLVAALFSLTNFLFGVFVLKESLHVSERRKFELKRANPIGALVQVKRFERLKYLFVVFLLVFFVNMSVHSTWNYYTMNKFNWSIRDVGISLTIVGVCTGIVQAVLSGKLIHKLGYLRAGTFGLCLLVFVMIAIGSIPSGWMLYLLIFPYAMTGIVDPAIRSLISGKVEKNEQGELQGIFTSLMSIGEIFGPPFFMWVYYTFSKQASDHLLYYGVSFFVAAAIALLALIVFRNVFSTQSNHEE